MAQDFRMVAEAVKRTIKEMDQRDSNWKWKATITKKEVRIFWGYLEYLEAKNPFVITMGSADRQECNIGDDTFVVLRDEHNYFIDGRIIGDRDFEDGDLESCVVSLMRALQEKVNNEY